MRGSELGKSAGSCDLETTQTVLVTPNNVLTYLLTGFLSLHNRW